METFTIQLPSFSFPEIALQEAHQMERTYLYGRLNPNTIKDTGEQIKRPIAGFINREDKVVYIGEIINIIHKKIVDHRPHCTSLDPLKCATENSYRWLQYTMYKELKDLGIDLDSNSFTEEDIKEAESKLDKILSALEEIKAGQTVTFEEVEAIKRDLEELKSDFALGKKRWYQRFAGIILSKAGDKAFNAAYDHMKPLGKELWKMLGSEASKILS